MRIILAASGGGHLEQIKQLDSLKDEHTVRYLVTKSKTNRTMRDVLFVPEYRNNLPLPVKLFDFFRIYVVSLFLVLREKPDVIISTGAAATYPICWFQKKLRHKKVIYIESFARKTSGSKTGKMVYKFADSFIVQRKELLSVYPNAVYGGMIY